MPKFTIVTVCFNSKDTISDTINSVLEQTYSDYEYIIIDGGSTDGTVEKILSYGDSVNTFVSEKDNGIYDAMNKAIDIAKGEYIFFLNSGDHFYDNDVLKEVNKVSEGKYNIIYGYVSNGNDLFSKRVIKHSLQLSITTICHQAIFAKTSCIKKEKFDLNYKYLSDYKWLLNCFDSDTSVFFDRCISYFSPESHSLPFSLQFERLKEKVEISSQHTSKVFKILAWLDIMRLSFKFTSNKMFRG